MKSFRLVLFAFCLFFAGSSSALNTHADNKSDPDQDLTPELSKLWPSITRLEPNQPIKLSDFNLPYKRGQKYFTLAVDSGPEMTFKASETTKISVSPKNFRTLNEPSSVAELQTSLKSNESAVVRLLAIWPINHDDRIPLLSINSDFVILRDYAHPDVNLREPVRDDNPNIPTKKFLAQKNGFILNPGHKLQEPNQEVLELNLISARFQDDKANQPVRFLAFVIHYHCDQARHQRLTFYIVRDLKDVQKWETSTRIQSTSEFFDKVSKTASQ